MLKKLRRGSSQSTVKSKTDSRNPSITGSIPLRQSSIASAASSRTAPAAEEQTSTTTFFSLPAELRNTIYTLLATQTSLTLFPSGNKRTSHRYQPPSLLLASKRLRQEFLPILLSVAPLRVRVKDFNFWNVMRVSASLYASERRALRENPALQVLLVPAGRCTREAVACMRRWLVYRSSSGAGVGGLPWGYGVVWNEERSDDEEDEGGSGVVAQGFGFKKSDVVKKRRIVLLQNLEALRVLFGSVEENLRWEMGPILEILERELEKYGTGLPVNRLGIGQTPTACERR